MNCIDVATRATALLLAMHIAGCGESGPPTVGTTVTFDTVCDKANEDKRVALEGYLDFPNQFKSKEITIMMRLRHSPFAKDKVVGASVKLGTGPNHVALPPKAFTAKDVKVTANDGKTAGYADKVRVSGTMYYPIMATQEFKCGLTNTLIESVGSSGK
jgi:hypothetical protein